MANTGDQPTGGPPSDRRDCRALVLAGGGSRRFGSDKLEAAVEGSSVLDHVIRSIRVVTEDITIVGRQHPGCRWIADPEPRHGPLSAISHALDVLFPGGAPTSGHRIPPMISPGSTSNAVLVVGGDHPLVRPAVLSLTVDSLGDHEAAVPLDHEGRPQPLVACYRSSLDGAMREALDAGRYGLVRLLGTVDVVWIGPDRWRSVDPEGRSFLDVDTADDLLRIQQFFDEPDGSA